MMDNTSAQTGAGARIKYSAYVFLVHVQLEYRSAIYTWHAFCHATKVQSELPLLCAMQIDSVPQ